MSHFENLMMGLITLEPIRKVRNEYNPLVILNGELWVAVEKDIPMNPPCRREDEGTGMGTAAGRHATLFRFPPMTFYKSHWSELTGKTQAAFHRNIEAELIFLGESPEQNKQLYWWRGRDMIYARDLVVADGTVPKWYLLNVTKHFHSTQLHAV